MVTTNSDGTTVLQFFSRFPSLFLEFFEKENHVTQVHEKERWENRRDETLKISPLLGSAVWIVSRKVQASSNTTGGENSEF